MNYIEPGRKKGETKEEGQRRRHKENVKRTKAWVEEIRRREADRLEFWRRVIDEKFGNYEDKPL